MFSFLRRLGTPEIDLAALDTLLAQGAIRVLDIREEAAFKGGHLPGAINIPAKKLPDRVARLRHDKPYAVICGSGNDSRRVTDFLVDQGYPGTVSVTGGTSAWAKSGRAIVR